MSRIIIHFFVGSDSRTGVTCRLVLDQVNYNDRSEKLTVDALGERAWVPVDNVRGMPAKDILVRRALAKILDPSLVEIRVGGRLWPEGVTKTAAGFEVDLGRVS